MQAGERRRPAFIDYVPPRFRREIQSLTPGEASTLQLIASFMRWKLGVTGDPVKARCFTYDSIFRHAERVRSEIPPLSLDRHIRRLKARGILYAFDVKGRGGRKRRVICVDRELAQGILDYLRALEDWEQTQ